MRRIAVLVLMTGCAAAPGVAFRDAAPEAAILYRDTVTVTFTDGTLCARPRTAGAGGWSGRLAGCPHPWDVAVLSPAGAPREVLTRGAGADAVVVTAPDGTRTAFGRTALAG